MPARSASTSDSAIAWLMANTTALTASFIAAPAPGPPTSITWSAMPRSTGIALASGRSSPAAMISSLRALRRGDASRHRRLDEVSADVGQLASRRVGVLDASRAHVDDDVSRRQAGDQPVVTAEQVEQRRAVGQHRDDHRAALAQRAWRGDGCGPRLGGERIGDRRGPVVHGHREPGVDQLAGHRPAHAAEPGEPDVRCRGGHLATVIPLTIVCNRL